MDMSSSATVPAPVKAPRTYTDFSIESIIGNMNQQTQQTAWPQLFPFAQQATLNQQANTLSQASTLPQASFSLPQVGLPYLHMQLPHFPSPQLQLHHSPIYQAQQFLVQHQQPAEQPVVSAAQPSETKSAKKVRPKNFQCPACKMAFSNNGQLRNHIRIHTGERPFKCKHPNCGKTFTRNEELTRHKLIHTGVRPHACLACGKKFGRKDHLKKHIRTHQKKQCQQLNPEWFNSPEMQLFFLTCKAQA